MATQPRHHQQQLHISCLCGAAAQTLQTRPGRVPGGDGLATPALLCHCADCRRGTGLLFTSYAPVSPPPGASSLAALARYDAGAGVRVYFCRTCGCHVLRHRRVGGGDGKGEGEGEELWEVATGTIVDSQPTGNVAEEKEEAGQGESESGWAHAHAASTLDGGASVWIPGRAVPDSEAPRHGSLGGASTTAKEPAFTSTSTSTHQQSPAVLPASCHCGTVRFHLTPPNAASREPRSGFSDLVHPFCSTDASIVANPGDAKWWLRTSAEGTTRYMAGLCACRSCRLISGFEIQAWAFVPRVNIVMHVSRGGSSVGDGDSESEAVALDFDALARLDNDRNPLASHESSSGVVREFCRRCGATVFWHDRWRPDLIDVSVGLLRATPEEGGGGARAEAWLEWWTGRVSFAEEVGTGRAGPFAERARRLVSDIEEHMKGWKQGGLPGRQQQNVAG